MTLALTDLQHAMLAEMGVKLWLPAKPMPTGSAGSAGAAVAAGAAGAAGAAAQGLAKPSTEAQTPHKTSLTAVNAASSQFVSGQGLAGNAVNATPVGRPARKENAPLAPPSASATSAVRAEFTANIAQADWGALQNQVAGCTACGLCQSRKNTVFGSGEPGAKLMIVGEAPGQHEDEQAQPFVGAAGALLSHMLAAMGLQRSEVFITNVLKCRPPANRNPAAEEVAQCAPYLQRQIALVQPHIILALGRFAAQSLLAGNPLANAPLGQLRGMAHHYVPSSPSNSPEGAEASATPLRISYHPAYLLRSPAEKAKAWQDLSAVAALLQTA